MVARTGDVPLIPFTAGLTGNDPLTSSTLGISVYARPPAEQPTLRRDLAAGQPKGGNRWASVEWGLGASWAPEGMKKGTVDAWVAAYNATLSFGDCRLLAVYNWNPGDSAVPLVAARRMLQSWTRR